MYILDIKPVSERAQRRLGTETVRVMVTSALSQPTKLGNQVMQRPILVDCAKCDPIWVDLGVDVKAV